MITEIVFVLLGMALMKGVVEPIVATQTQRLAKHYVPLLLDKLDPMMPSFIAHHSPDELRRIIFRNLLEIDPTLTSRQQEQLLNQLCKEYDPIANAGKLNHVRSRNA